MTVAVQTPISSYSANGVTTVFAFAYKVLQSSDLVVEVTDTDGNTAVKTLGADYTVAGIGAAGGGTVTFLTAPTAGYTVTIYRSSQLARSVDYQDNGDLFAAVLNPDFDRIWLALQELVSGNHAVPNAIHAQPGETLDVLPAPVGRLDRLLVFDAVTGQPELSDFTVTQLASALATIYAGSAGPLDSLTFLQAGTGAVTRSAQDKARETVTPEDFGAVGDGSHDDTAAWARTFTYLQSIGGGTIRARKSYYIPHGLAVTADNVVIDGMGCGAIHSVGAANEHGIHGSSISNLTLQNLAVYIPRTNTRAGGICICPTTVAGFTVRNCRTDGGCVGVWAINCTDVLVEGCHIDTPKADGIHFGQGSQRCKAIGNTIINPGDDALSVTYDAGYGRPTEIVFANNVVVGGYWGNGAAVYSADRVTITGNTFTNIALAAVLVYVNAGGAESTDVLIANNNITGVCRAEVMPNSYWFGTDPALDPVITASSQTSGMYLAGSIMTVSGNKMSEASSSPNGHIRHGMTLGKCEMLAVVGNTFYDVNGNGIQFGSDALSQINVDHNVFENVFGVAIVATNAIGTAFSICGNTQGPGATMGSPYMIQIAGTGTTRGMVCHNVSSSGNGISNDGLNSLLVLYNNFFQKNVGQSYTPTVTANAGALTSYTVNAAKFIVNDQIIHLELDITIVNNGTGSDAIAITLPATAAAKQMMVGREEGVTGAMVAGRILGSSMLVRTYNNGYPGGAGARIVITGTYEWS